MNAGLGGAAARAQGAAAAIPIVRRRCQGLARAAAAANAAIGWFRSRAAAASATAALARHVRRRAACRWFASLRLKGREGFLLCVAGADGSPSRVLQTDFFLPQFCQSAWASTAIATCRFSPSRSSAARGGARLRPKTTPTLDPNWPGVAKRCQRRHVTSRSGFTVAALLVARASRTRRRPAALRRRRRRGRRIRSIRYARALYAVATLTTAGAGA